MPKKKARKKAARKVAPKKKAKKSLTKKSGGRSSQKTRKPARKPSRKSPPAKKSTVTGGGGYPPPVPFAVVPKQCSILPPDQHFPAFGWVIFNVASDCTLVFSDPKVLGLPSPELPLMTGSHKHEIKVSNGFTKFYIKGCPIENGPADITVP